MGDAAKYWDEDNEHVLQSSNDQGKTWHDVTYVDGVQQAADLVNESKKTKGLMGWLYRTRATGKKSDMGGDAIANVDAVVYDTNTTPNHVHYDENTGTYWDSRYDRECDRNGDRI
jgi:hypothetical protein